MLTTKPKCLHCKKRFTPEEARKRLHDECIEPWMTAYALKRDAKKARAEKAKDRATREKQKTIGQLIDDTQAVFNAYIRLRDHGKPCICCGRPMELDVLGNPKVNAGHWRTRGAAGHLRFVETNVHSQRVSCNRPGGANAGAFREGMIGRVGLDEVERLESSNEVEKWDREILRNIKATYWAKYRQLLKERA